MNIQAIGRIVSIAIGAAILFGLEQGLGWKLYVAIPCAILAYAAARFAFAILAAPNPDPK